MKRVVTFCAALLPAALGLGLLQLYIDERIDAATAVAGALVLVLVAAIAAAIHVELRSREASQMRRREVRK